MSILVYSPNQDSDEQRLLENISFAPIEMCRCIDQLRCCLNVPGPLRKIVILFLLDPVEMNRISKLLELYLDLLLIIILDQDLLETTKDVHKLRPRYITYKGGDFRDVATVLKRIMKRLK